jgi:hypothetical protein
VTLARRNVVNFTGNKALYDNFANVALLKISG